MSLDGFVPWMPGRLGLKHEGLQMGKRTSGNRDHDPALAEIRTFQVLLVAIYKKDL